MATNTTNKTRIALLEKTQDTNAEYTCWLDDFTPGQVTARSAAGQALTFEICEAMTAYFDGCGDKHLTIIQFVDEEPDGGGDL